MAANDDWQDAGYVDVPVSPKAAKADDGWQDAGYVDVEDDPTKAMADAWEAEATKAAERRYDLEKKYGKDYDFDTVSGRLSMLGRGMKEGAGANWGDELTAGLSGLLGGDVDKTLKEERERNELLHMKAPDNMRAANIAGTLSTALIPGVGAGLNTYKGAALMGALANVGANDDKNLLDSAGDAALGAAGGVAGNFLFNRGMDLGKLGVGSVVNTIKGKAAGKPIVDAVKEGVKEAAQNVEPLNMLAVGAKEFKKNGRVKSFGAIWQFAKNKNAIDKLKSAVLEAMPEVKPGYIENMTQEEFLQWGLAHADPKVADFFVHNSTLGNLSNAHPEDLRRLLTMTPEERIKAADFGREKMGIAKALKPDVEAAGKGLDDAMGYIASTDLKRAEGEYAPRMAAGVFDDVRNAYRQAKDVESVPKDTLKYIKESFNIGEGGIDLNKSGFTRGARFTDVSPAEQVKRLRAMRQAVDNGIDYDLINSQGIPNKGTAILTELRGNIDQRLKLMPSQVKADDLMSSIFDLQKNLFKQTEFKGGVDASKLRRLFSDTDKTARFKDSLEALRDWSKDSRIPGQYRQLASGMLKKFDILYKRADNLGLMNKLRYVDGPSGTALKSLQASIGHQNTLHDAMLAPTQSLGQLDNFIRDAPKYFGKSFKDMSDHEKQAFIKLRVFVTNEARRKNFIQPDDLKTYWKYFLSKSKGSGRGGQSLVDAGGSDLQNFIGQRAGKAMLDTGLKAAGVENGTDDVDPGKRLGVNYLRDKYNLNDDQVESLKKVMPGLFDIRINGVGARSLPQLRFPNILKKNPRPEDTVRQPLVPRDIDESASPLARYMQYQKPIPGDSNSGRGKLLTSKLFGEDIPDHAGGATRYNLKNVPDGLVNTKVNTKMPTAFSKTSRDVNHEGIHHLIGQLDLEMPGGTRAFTNHVKQIYNDHGALSPLDQFLRAHGYLQSSQREQELLSWTDTLLNGGEESSIYKDAMVDIVFNGDREAFHQWAVAAKRAYRQSIDVAKGLDQDKLYDMHGDFLDRERKNYSYPMTRK